MYVKLRGIQLWYVVGIDVSSSYWRISGSTANIVEPPRSSTYTHHNLLTQNIQKSIKLSENWEWKVCSVSSDVVLVLFIVINAQHDYDIVMQILWAKRLDIHFQQQNVNVRFAKSVVIYFRLLLLWRGWNIFCSL